MMTETKKKNKGVASPLTTTLKGFHLFLKKRCRRRLTGWGKDKTFVHHLITIVSRAAWSGPPHLTVFMGIAKGTLIYNQLLLGRFILLATARK